MEPQIYKTKKEISALDIWNRCDDIVAEKVDVDKIMDDWKNNRENYTEEVIKEIQEDTD